jgi:hypothetical protein
VKVIGVKAYRRVEKFLTPNEPEPTALKKIINSGRVMACWKRLKATE